MEPYTLEHCDRLLKDHPEACIQFYNKIRKGVVMEQALEHRDHIRRALADGPKTVIEAAKWCRANGDPLMDAQLAGLIVSRLVKEGEAILKADRFERTQQLKIATSAPVKREPLAGSNGANAAQHTERNGASLRPLIERILDVVNRQDGECGAQQVIKILSAGGALAPSYTSVAATLCTLANRGMIERRSPGRYGKCTPVQQKPAEEVAAEPAAPAAEATPLEKKLREIAAEMDARIADLQRDKAAIERVLQMLSEEPNGRYSAAGLGGV